MAMKFNHGSPCLFLVTIFTLILTSSLSPATAYTFNVGGKDGWVVKPSEYYSHWAQRNRFQVNDTLYFKYKKGSDSVVVVNNEDYDWCNPKNQIQKMEDGDSSFKFDRSGPFFFISGNVENCQRGQKLIVVVLAVRHKHEHHHIQSYPRIASPSPAPSMSPSMGPSNNPNFPKPLTIHSGSTSLSGSVGLTLGLSIGMVMFFNRLFMVDLHAFSF